jgi:hypothetical protein
MESIYLIGSLRQPRVREVATALRLAGHDVFDDWHAAGPEADEVWKAYEKERGRTFLQALEGDFVDHAFKFDFAHLSRCDVGVLVLPAGRSGHLELGYMAGEGKRTYILLEQEEPERWDMMYLLADEVVSDVGEIVKSLKGAL